MTTAEPHGWHLFDDVMGYVVRQTTGPDTDNLWELKTPDGATYTLDDDEFDQLRDLNRDNPKGIALWQGS